MRVPGIEDDARLVFQGKFPVFVPIMDPINAHGLYPALEHAVQDGVFCQAAVLTIILRAQALFLRPTPTGIA